MVDCLHLPLFPLQYYYQWHRLIVNIKHLINVWSGRKQLICFQESQSSLWQSNGKLWVSRKTNITHFLSGQSVSDLFYSLQKKKTYKCKCMKVHYTVKPHSTDTCLKAHIFSVKLTGLIWTLVKTDNKHFSESQVRNSHIMSTLLNRHWVSAYHFHCLLIVNIDERFLR